MHLIERKADTRHKIIMGGLIKKAGLDNLHKTNPAALLGALLEIKNNFDLHQINFLNKYEPIGKLAFDRNHNNSN